MNWKDAPIDGIGLEPFSVFSDDRGWLAELFRRDELPAQDYPAMGYLSSTKAGIARGPHEHVSQTDRFAFFHGEYTLFLWDSRQDSPSYGSRMSVSVGAQNPVVVTVPPGVVHAYRNEGAAPAFVLNFPDQLYAGQDKKEEVDEIRHEEQESSIYTM